MLSPNKNSALTFIDTLLSSQRTRTHHCHRPHGNAGAYTLEFQTWLITFEPCLGCSVHTPYNLVVPVREDRVGVRVALTRQKLREDQHIRKSPGQM